MAPFELGHRTLSAGAAVSTRVPAAPQPRIAVATSFRTRVSVLALARPPAAQGVDSGALV